MRVSKDFIEILRCCAMLSMRNFESIATMAAEGEVNDTDMQSLLNDVKALEDMIYAVSNVYKCEKAYPEDKRNSLNHLAERVTANMIMTAAVALDPDRVQEMLAKAREVLRRKEEDE